MRMNPTMETSNNNRHSITAFFPAFNDAATIKSVVLGALSVLRTLTDDYEVIVVNDGSTDETPALLDALAHSQPQVRIVHHTQNEGYGAALRSGFAHARKELIFYTDGDGQYDIRELTRLYSFLNAAVDVVNGFKIKRADNRQRKIVGGIYNRLARLLFRLPIRDVDCDFRLIRRRAVAPLKLTSASGAICIELVRKLHAAGCRFAEVPVHHYPRAFGRSQFFTPRRVARTTHDFLILWLRLVLLRRTD
jgi:glycosyltransferase involved in cell wall biosynthesis